MEFKTRKIKNYNIENSNNLTLKTKKFKISLPIVSLIIIIGLLFTGIVKALTSIDFTLFLKAAGEELLEDAYGHTNFLLLGTASQGNEGEDLTDTIIVASLDNENKLVTILSIPRDLYIKDATIGNSKINEIFYNAKIYYKSSTLGLEYTKEKIEEIVGIPIHYWAKINFDGFKELISALGGIDLYVENAIYDPTYPKDGTFLHEPFSISEGQHHMDGETALKYARSRKTTSDFDRADRQQKIIYAIKEKALQTNVLFSKEKITNILSAIKNNIETNIKTEEILTLGAISKDITENKIAHKLIHDDPTKCGGFLYTPSREFYNGMFVLIPAGGFEFLHLYSDLNFNTPLILNENARLHILNGTNTSGVAGETKQILKRFCFDITRFGNAKSKDIKETKYYYQPKYDEKGEIINKKPEALSFLTKIIPGKISTEIPEEYKEYLNTADIIIELGEDYVKSDKYIIDSFYYLPAPVISTPTTTTTETSTTQTNEN